MLANDRKDHSSPLDKSSFYVFEIVNARKDHSSPLDKSSFYAFEIVPNVNDIFGVKTDAIWSINPFVSKIILYNFPRVYQPLI